MRADYILENARDKRLVRNSPAGNDLFILPDRQGACCNAGRCRGRLAGMPTLRTFSISVCVLSVCVCVCV